MSNMLVLGLGKTGIASARRLLDEGGGLVIYAGTSSEANKSAAQEFIDAGVEVIFDDESIEGKYDTCVISPGIPQTGDFYQSAQAHCTEVISEPEFAWRISPQDWVAVTGTNGKTTTTSLIAHLLRACGKPAQACGNIGDTCLDAVSNRKPQEILVAELSSYQLASTVHFAPQVAVLLNITPDHISWHGGFYEYAKAKFKEFENMNAGSTAVISKSVLDAYPELLELVNERDLHLITVGSKLDVNCAYEDSSGQLVYVDGTGISQEVIHVDELAIKGAHNVENALCAISAAYAMGCKTACLHEGLANFNPLEHRLESAGAVNGVEYFNDSKATNVDATLKALTAFPNKKIILLLGGRDKGTALEELVDACKQTCEAIIAYGEAGQRFYDAFAGSPISAHLEKGMKEALNHALKIAHENNVVVLSPACASFDEFNSFEHRGEVFKELVQEYSKA